MAVAAAAGAAAAQFGANGRYQSSRIEATACMLHQ